MNAISLALNTDYDDYDLGISIPNVDQVFQIPIAHSEAPSEAFSITISRQEGSRAQAVDLLNRRYSWRGYGANQKLSGRRHETTFVARLGDRVIGTVTLGVDCPHGLAADSTFPDEMQYFRLKSNAALCELKKFAVDYSDDTKYMLSALFHFVFIYGAENRMGTDLFIEVNPRHIIFYERMLGFKRVGKLKTNESVNAPSQLMWLSVDSIPQMIEAGFQKKSRHSLYNYFFDERVQEKIKLEMKVRGLS